MGWLENLKSFVNVDVSQLKAIKLSLFSGNRNAALFKYETHDNSRHVHLQINVNAHELDEPAIRQQIQAIVKEATLAAYDQPLLEAAASQRLQDFAANQDDGAETLAFFTGKIPDADIPILRAALYMRSVHRRGLPVDGLKHDIMERFGVKGSNIANLCSTGYFESELRPMYEELAARPNFTAQLFIDSYDVIVDNAPFAVFVGRSRSLEDLVGEVGQKLLTNRQYGIHQMNLHAIGTDNVQKLQCLLQDARILANFTSEPAIASQGSVMNGFSQLIRNRACVLGSWLAR